MEIHFKIIGGLLLFLSVIHVYFPAYFNWRTELASISLINRQMMTVHTFFIALIVFFMGLLCLLFSTDLMQTRLGKMISLGLGIFWAIRLFFQFFVYSSELWKGKKFETRMHILFSILWLYMSVVFLWSAIPL